MLKELLILFFTIITLCLNAQQSPYISNGLGNLTKTFFIDSEKHFIIGNIEDHGETQETVLLKFDSTGNCLDSLRFNETEKSIIYRVEELVNEYILYGMINEDGVYKFFISSISLDFERKWITFYPYYPYYDLIGYNMKNYRIGDYIYIFINDATGSQLDCYKLDYNYQLISYEIINIDDDLDYQMLIDEPFWYNDAGFVFGASGYLIHVDYDFHVDTVVNLCDILYNYHFYLKSQLFVLNNNGFIISLDYRTAPVVAFYDSAFVLKDTFMFGENTYDKRAWVDNMAMSPDSTKYYYTGFTNMCIGHSSWFGSYYPNHMYVAGFNQDSMIWRKKVGGDAYYTPFNILPASNNGCYVVYGKYDHVADPGYNDVYITHFDSVGNSTFTSILSPDRPAENTVVVYPNPGQDQIRIKSSVIHGNAEFQLIDINGRQVLQTNCSTNTSIDVSALQTGIYFFRVFNQTEIIGTGKWVKE